MRFFLIVTSLLFLGAGCRQVGGIPVVPASSSSSAVAVPPSVTETTTKEPLIVSPLNGSVVGCEITLKGFGEYIRDRFSGYHTGIDCEVDPVDLSMHHIAEVPVQVVADGRVTYAGRASGYGGVLVVAHEIDGQTFSTLYGHLDLGATPVRVGDRVTKGQKIATLGEHESVETDGERMHLHFAVWSGDAVKLAGYVKTPVELSGWKNPYDFLMTYGGDVARQTLGTDAHLFLPGKDSFDQLALDIPEGLAIEYVPSLDAVNLYTVAGEGSARARSQFFLRYFDADQFLTLSTVDVLETKERPVGRAGYVARQYRIKKKAGVVNFADQPSWRNEEHTVIDFRDKAGRTRYWVIAVRPGVSEDAYEKLLVSVDIP